MDSSPTLNLVEVFQHSLLKAKGEGNGHPEAKNLAIHWDDKCKKAAD